MESFLGTFLRNVTEHKLIFINRIFKMMKKIVLFTLILSYSFILFGQQQKKPLTFEDILSWKRITNTLISNDGKHIVYQQTPWKGDPILSVTNPNGDELESILYGNKAAITADSKYLVYRLSPPVDSIRGLKLNKVKKEDLPIDKLCIYKFESKTTETFDRLKSLNVPKEWSGWIAWQTELPKDTISKKTSTKVKSKLPLYIKDFSAESVRIISGVTDYKLAEENEVITYITEGDSLIEPGVYALDLKNNTETRISGHHKEVKQLCIHKNGDKVAFLAKAKNDKKAGFSIYSWNGSGEAEMIVKDQDSSILQGWMISENGSLSFSENGKRLFYGTAPQNAEKDTTVLEEEKPVLDIWHWKEDYLQTVQLVNKEKDLKKSYLAVYHFDTKQSVQLETEKYSGIIKAKKGDADNFVAYSNKPYALQTMWEGRPYHNDFYIVDVFSGKAKLIKKDCRATPFTSPGGNYIFWYNATDTTWNTYDLNNREFHIISTPERVQIANELNDRPMLPGSYSYAGWLENDAALLVYDRYDIWKLDPTNREEPINLTMNGRLDKINYRLVRFNVKRNDEIVLDEDLLIKGHHEKTRSDGYYSFDINKTQAPKALLVKNFKYNVPLKAKNRDIVVFTKEDFETYPDLIASNLKFKKQKQISHLASQQEEYWWGTSEMVSWKSLGGEILEGTLHKPENFDPTKKYPMIVNFYERSSDRLLSYRMPQNHQSTIDYHYYTSNGYVVFNPDIHYTEGHPGESAYNCIIPGIQQIISRGFVDPKKIGANGHSWGGYQVAYLATRTNIFAAIESGAPVVNMFSAYGGIRWKTGLSRSFQYEHTQSRLGKNIWEAPNLYFENSPLFKLDKVETPILIMHNDDDGYVPWYQGIEFFIGLRRLGKPCWLLNYNHADHWPLKIADQHDFQIRMAQFFDHYLKGKPMPVWMKNGIPAVKKGIELGYELVE